MNELSKERLEELANAEYCKANPGKWLLGLKEINSMARELLALRERSEPVAATAEITALERQRDELLAALEDIIAYNVQYATDKYGDASKAETMACVRRSREAIARAATLTSQGKDG
ncbi:hypothetical protein SMB57_003073 [Cronobacter sakazakii]|nr:hypothetical protein [Cronobacter sakazakii]